MTNLNGLTNPFENAVESLNYTQLAKQKRLDDYSEAVSLGYEPPQEILEAIDAILVSGVLDADALAALEDLVGEILSEIAPMITSNGGGDTATIQFDENSTALVTTVAAIDRYSLNDQTASLVYAISGADAEYFAIDAQTGELSFLTPPDFEGGPQSFDIVVKVYDGDSLFDAQTVEVLINDVNEAPTLDAGFANAVEDGPTISIDLATLGDDIDSNDDGSTLTYALIGQASEGTASIVGATLIFDPGSDFQELADGETRDIVLTVQATDNQGASVENTVTITVTGGDEGIRYSMLFSAAIDGSGGDLYGIDENGNAVLIADIVDGPDGGDPGRVGGFGNVGDTVVFVARSSDSTYSLQRLTPDGQVEIVGNVGQGVGPSGAPDFIPFAGGLVFAGSIGQGQELLFVGETGGVSTFANVNTEVINGNDLSSFPGQRAGVREFNGKLVFDANSDEFGREVFSVDTDGNVELYANLRAGSAGSSEPGRLLELIEFNGALYVDAQDKVNGSSTQLFRLDGNNQFEAVASIDDPNNGPSARVSDALVFNDALYFGAVSDAGVTEMHVLDKLENVTKVTTENGDSVEIILGNSDFTEFDGALYFAGSSIDVGAELFVVDSTGTVALVDDINSGSASSNAGRSSGLAVLGDELLFGAVDEAEGLELHSLDSNGNVSVLSDFGPGVRSESIGEIEIVGGIAYFAVREGPEQSSLYRYDGNAVEEVLTSDGGTLQGVGNLQSQLDYFDFI